MEKPTIVLDLDETLIHSIPCKIFIKDDENTYFAETHKDIIHNMDYEYVVLERPHLQEFLDFIFKHFNVSVWTAANKDYALFIIEHCILSRKKGKSYRPQSQRKLDFIFYDKHRDRSYSVYGKNSPKQLNLLWESKSDKKQTFGLTQFNPNTTFIIDDHPQVKEKNPNNCISMVPFATHENEDETDLHLKKMMKDDQLVKLQKYFQNTLLPYYQKNKTLPKPLILK